MENSNRAPKFEGQDRARFFEDQDRQMKRDQIKAERTAKLERDRNKFAKLGKRIAIILGVIVTAGTIVMSGGEKHLQKNMPKEEWEDNLKLGGHNAKKHYSESGSSVILEESFNGVDTQYTLLDTDNDTLINVASASNAKGGAGYESDGDGVTPAEAINILNEKMENGEK